MSSINFSPDGETPNVYCRQERCSILRITGGNTTPAFQFQKCIFNQMPKAIQIFVVIPWGFAIFPGRDNRMNMPRLKKICKNITVIASVCQQMVRVYVFDKSTSLCAISNGTCCNKHSDRHTMRIHGQMYLGVKPPFVRAMSWFPPLAPAACG